MGDRDAPCLLYTSPSSRPPGQPVTKPTLSRSVNNVPAKSVFKVTSAVSYTHLDVYKRQVHGRWAEFRFGVVGGLFSAPPARGELGRALQALAERLWTHPISGEPTRFDESTIARWYYAARGKPDNPVGALRPRVRRDRGQHRPRFVERVWAALAELYATHPGWTYQLHADNLRVRVQHDASPRVIYEADRQALLQLSAARLVEDAAAQALSLIHI